MFDEALDVLQVVLAIGIHLQGVAETQARCFAQTGHDRAALALVFGEADQVNHVTSGQAIQHPGAGRAAGIVHQDARQMAGDQRIDHRGDGCFVVVHRDDGAGAMHVGSPL
ncbi:hypothetical protein D3C81_1352080 [compost metagenome]